MTKEEFITLMNEDLQNEYMHMHFYLHSAVMVQGFHRQEIGEYLLEEAQSEMKHCEEFARKIIGLGGLPTVNVNPFPTTLVDPYAILSHVLLIEQEVVENYAKRLKQAEELGGADGAVLEVFYEDQILDSRNTAEHVQKMLEGYVPSYFSAPFYTPPPPFYPNYEEQQSPPWIEPNVPPLYPSITPGIPPWSGGPTVTCQQEPPPDPNHW